MQFLVNHTHLYSCLVTLEVKGVLLSLRCLRWSCSSHYSLASPRPLQMEKQLSSPGMQLSYFHSTERSQAHSPVWQHEWQSPSQELISHICVCGGGTADSSCPLSKIYPKQVTLCWQNCNLLSNALWSCAEEDARRRSLAYWWNIVQQRAQGHQSLSFLLK